MRVFNGIGVSPQSTASVVFRFEFSAPWAAKAANQKRRIQRARDSGRHVSSPGRKPGVRRPLPTSSPQSGRQNWLERLDAT